MKKLSVFILILIFALSLGACRDQTQNLPHPDPDEPDNGLDDTTIPVDIVYEYIDGETYTTPMDITIPENADSDTIKQIAYQMYCIANNRDQDCLRRAAISRCLVTTKAIGIKANEAKKIVYDIKNGIEYLKYDFQPTVGPAAGFGKAYYARLDLPYSLYLNAGDSDITDWVGTADFANPKEMYLHTKIQDMCYHTSQAHTYQTTEAIILPETILSASITHNDEEGYYIVKMSLDASNEVTTRILLPNLRAGSSMTRSANYTSFEETFEIWDNGFLKYFKSIDRWKAGLISGTIDYESNFYYTEQACDLTAYNNNTYRDIKVLAEEANAAWLAKHQQ